MYKETEYKFANNPKDMGLYFAADPEFCFLNSRGEVIPSEFMLSIYRLESWGFGHDFKVVPDGVQAEIHTGLNHCREYFQDGFWKIFNRMRVNNIRFSLNAVNRVDLKKLKEFGASPSNFVSGCNPDFNAYTREKNPTNVDYSEWPYRECGGHMHFFWGKLGYTGISLMKNKFDVIPLIKALDGTVGILSVLLTKGNPEEARRRKVVGKAGCFRMSSTHVEYRTPSNFWLRSPRIVSLLFGVAREVITRASRENRIFIPENEELVQKCINENDYELALKFWGSLKSLGWIKERTLVESIWWERIGKLRIYSLNTEWKLDKAFSFHGGTGRGFFTWRRQ